jgi:DNA-binding LytR/AlgR family response regulator
MSRATHILIVEDEMAIAMDIERRLQRMGYIVDGIAIDAEEALRMIDASPPDLLLMDIQLGTGTEGIHLSKKSKDKPFPIVFLTAFSDPGTFAQALDTQPAGYVLKPFRDDDLQRTIEIALQQTGEAPSNEVNVDADFFFIRDKGGLVRLRIDEICWLEALDNYTRVHTASKTYTVKAFLKDLYEKLPARSFIRVHRSFVVQLAKISRIEETTIYIDKQSIAIGRQYRDELMQRLRIL